MPDKLICPFCGEPLDIIDEDNDYLTCGNFHCCGGFCVQAEVWKQIITWKQSATALQKKLDKAMDVLDAVIETFEESPGYEKLAVMLIKQYKEIEDIKE